MPSQTASPSPVPSPAGSPARAALEAPSLGSLLPLEAIERRYILQVLHLVGGRRVAVHRPRPREYNLALGERRARAVREHLARMGVPPARLTTR